jgi:hypothetical protein
VKAAAIGSIRHLPRVDWGRALATFLLSVTVLSMAGALVLWAGQSFRPPPVSFIQGWLVFVAEMFYSVAYAAMGWLVATRLPRNVLGWVFLLLGMAMAMQLAVTFTVQESHQAFRPVDPAVLYAAWLFSSFHLPLIVLLSTVVFLRFPTGRLLSRRWALGGWLALLGSVLVGIAVAMSPLGLAWYPSLPNPMAAPRVMRSALDGATLLGLALMVAGVLAGVSSLIVRYRRSADVQRAQMRWIAAAVAILAAGGLPFVIVRYGLQLEYRAGASLMAIALVAGCFLPVAAAIAILRHRLYDIDLILNRALVYIPLTGILGGLYTAGVVLFQRISVAITGNTSDAAIIVSTLVMASLFTPVRNWLQGFVDRRFKPAPGTGGLMQDETLTIEQRLAQLEKRMANLEVGSDRSDW